MSSSLYAPLNESPVPSLEQVQNGGPPVEVTVVSPSNNDPEQKKIASQSQHVVSYAVVARNPEQESSRCLVTSCCCGCSLATGVLIISWLEALSWGMTFVGAVLSLYLKTQENKIDHAIVKHDADQDANADQPPPESPAEPTTEEKVEQTNMLIDIAAISAPFLVVMALIGLFFCVKGMTAAKTGNVGAAKSYMLWKRFTVAWAFIELIFGTSGGPIGGIISLAVAVYYFLVVRSYYVSLLQSSDSSGAQPMV